MGQDVSTTVRAPSTLRLDVGDLLRRPGASEPFVLHASIDGLELELVSVTEPVEADLRVDSIVDGAAVIGTLSARATGSCARCLTPIALDVEASVEEMYAASPSDENEDDQVYLLDGDILDLEPMIRDAVVLALPLNPLCRPDCLGLCPECGRDRNTDPCGHDTTKIDTRWDALRALSEDMEDPDARS